MAVGDADHQAGVISRQQLLARGWTSEEIQGQIRAQRWRRLHRGVYCTVTGPPARRSVLWAAVLASGEDAVLCGRSAAEVWGFGSPGEAVFVAVPREARSRPGLVGVRTSRVSNLVERVDRHADPPRTTVEDTVLDLVEESPDDTDAMGWITRALQARKTSPKRLLAASLRRRRLRRRELVEATCGFYRDGATSPLEIGWVRTVERPHCLPRAARQLQGTVGGRRVFHDLAYEAFGLFIELDGRLGHEGTWNAFRDMTRDNAAVAARRVTLRYGWTAVMCTPCPSAAQVAAVLRSRGWLGTARACGPDCAVLD